MYKYGIDKVLITCDHDNIASEKTIIANGGEFEKEICVDRVLDQYPGKMQYLSASKIVNGST